MSDFADRLAAMVSKEVAAAKGDTERLAEVVERMVQATGLSIALACRGDASAMATMLEGSQSYLYEAASENAPLASMLSRLRSA